MMPYIQLDAASHSFRLQIPQPWKYLSRQTKETTPRNLLYPVSLPTTKARSGSISIVPCSTAKVRMTTPGSRSATPLGDTLLFTTLLFTTISAALPCPQPIAATSSSGLNSCRKPYTRGYRQSCNSTLSEATSNASTLSPGVPTAPVRHPNNR